MHDFLYITVTHELRSELKKTYSLNSPEENMPMTIESRYNKNDCDGYVLMAKTTVPKARL